MNKQQRDRKLREQEKQLKEDIKVLMQQDSGRRFLHALLEQCGMYHEVYTPEQEGRRRVGLWVISKFNEHPETYIAMLQKNFQEARFQATVKEVEKTKQQQKENENEDDN